MFTKAKQVTYAIEIMNPFRQYGKKGIEMHNECLLNNAMVFVYLSGDQANKMYDFFKRKSKRVARLKKK